MGMVDYVGRSRKRILRGDIPTWILNREISARYIAAVVLSAPPWVDRWELYSLKHTAAALTIMTGVRHVLDHIIPLNHPLVCGLTVPWNIRIVPWQVNGSKGNRWEPDQMELFDTETYINDCLPIQSLQMNRQTPVGYGPVLSVGPVVSTDR